MKRGNATARIVASRSGKRIILLRVDPGRWGYVTKLTRPVGLAWERHPKDGRLLYTVWTPERERFVRFALTLENHSGIDYAISKGYLFFNDPEDLLDLPELRAHPSSAQVKFTKLENVDADFLQAVHDLIRRENDDTETPMAQRDGMVPGRGIEDDDDRGRALSGQATQRQDRRLDESAGRDADHARDVDDFDRDDGDERKLGTTTGGRAATGQNAFGAGGRIRQDHGVAMEASGQGSVEPDDGAGAGRRDGSVEPGVFEGRDQSVVDGLRILDDHDFLLASDEAIPEYSQTRVVEGLENVITLLDDENVSRDPETQRRIFESYRGVGGVPNLFDEHDTRFAENRERIRAMIDEREWNLLADSVLNAHYTDPMVARSMWKIAMRLGADDRRLGRPVRVLDPCVGSGVFPATRPRSLRMSLVAVDRDALAARVSTLLYPNAKVLESPFEATGIPDDSMDLIISNFPFGNYATSSVRYAGVSIHDAFILMAMDKLRPGGIVVALTSVYSMNSANDVNRRHLLKKGDLIDAWLLPEGVCAKMANTMAPMALVVFQKRMPNAPAPTPEEAGWVRSVRKKIGQHHHYLNEYFENHPERVLGDFQVGRGMYAEGVVLKAPTGVFRQHVHEFVAKRIEEAIEDLPANIVSEYDFEKPLVFDRRFEETMRDERENPFLNGMAPDSYVIGDDDELYQVEADRDGRIVLVRANLKKRQAELLRDFIPLRDQILRVIRVQVDEAPDETLAAEQEKLNRLYDAFVAKRACLNDPKLSRELAKLEPQYAFLQGFERYDERTGESEKTDFFHKRTIRAAAPPDRVDSPVEALALSIGVTGDIHFELIAQKLGVDVETAKAKLIEADLIFLDPESCRWEIAEKYLSGNVRSKYEIALQAATHNAAFERNVKALESVLPELVSGEEVVASVHPGAFWVPDDMVREFVGTMFGRVMGGGEIVRLSTGEWMVKQDIRCDAAAPGYEWGIDKHLSPAETLDAALNNKSLKIYVDSEDDESRVIEEQLTNIARTKTENVIRDFRNWIREDLARVRRLEDIYNRKINCFRAPDYSRIAENLFIPGLSPERPLRPAQKCAIARALLNPAMYMNHPVGAGKTAVGAVVAYMKARFSGARTLYVAPKAVLNQTAAEIRRWLPKARVLTMRTQDCSPDGRKKFLGKLVSDMYDIILITPETLDKITLPQSAVENYFRRRIDDYDMLVKEIEMERKLSGRGYGRNFSVKSLRRKKMHLINQLRVRQEVYEAQNNGKTDMPLSLDDLNVSALVVDEAHYFKNLSHPTFCDAPGVKVPQSQRAERMHIVIRHVLENEGSVCMMSGTPVTNAPVTEMYTILYNLAGRDALRQAGYPTLDAFIKQFGVISPDLEWTPTGTLKSVERVRAVKNVPELAMLFSTVTDTLRRKDLALIKKPDLENEIAVVEPSPLTETVNRLFAARAARLQHVDPKIDNILKLTSEGVLASVTPRLLLPLDTADKIPPIKGEGKIDAVVDMLYDNWRRGQERRSVALVFLDSGTPKKRGLYSVYDDIRRRLQSRGVPENEIAFVHEAKNDNDREKLFERVRRGDVRIFMGSTDKMGTGVNIPNKVDLMVHMDVPYTPARIEQRTGRGHRHGNENPKVKQVFVVQRDGIERFILGIVRNKANLIQSLTAHPDEVSTRSVALDEQPPFDHIIAEATGSDTYRKKVEIDNEVNKLSTEKKIWERQRANLMANVKNLLEILVANREMLEMSRKLVEKLSRLRLLDELSSALGKRAAEEIERIASDWARSDGENSVRMNLPNSGISLTLFREDGQPVVSVRRGEETEVCVAAPYDPERGVRKSLFGGFDSMKALERHMVETTMKAAEKQFYRNVSYKDEIGRAPKVAGVELDFRVCHFTKEDGAVLVLDGQDEIRMIRLSLTATISNELKKRSRMTKKLAQWIEKDENDMLESLRKMTRGIWMRPPETAIVSTIRTENGYWVVDEDAFERTLDNVRRNIVSSDVRQIMSDLSTLQYSETEKLNELLNRQIEVNEQVAKEFERNIPDIGEALDAFYDALIVASMENGGGQEVVHELQRIKRDIKILEGRDVRDDDHDDENAQADALPPRPDTPVDESVVLMSRSCP